MDPEEESRMSRHRPKVNPVIESMLNGALLAQMAFPGENGGRPLFQPGVLPVLPDDHALGTWVHEPIDWDSPYLEDGYATRTEENDDRAP
jgi:hypothetical protein